MDTDADTARHDRALARGRILEPAIQAMLAVPGTTIEDVQLTLRAWADTLGARVVSTEPSAAPLKKGTSP